MIPFNEQRPQQNLFTKHYDYWGLRCIILIARVFCYCSVYEKKCVSRGEALAPATQSKLSRVSSGFGLSKLTGVRRNKKENSLNKNSLSAQVNS